MTEIRKPRPRYGWHGSDSYCKFPIGAKVAITGGQRRMERDSTGIVLELGSVPIDISNQDDLVHVRITSSGFMEGVEAWWNEWQLELIDD